MSNEIHILRRDNVLEFRTYNDTFCGYTDRLEGPKNKLDDILPVPYSDTPSREWKKLVNQAQITEKYELPLVFYDLDGFGITARRIASDSVAATVGLSDDEKKCLRGLADWIGGRNEYGSVELEIAGVDLGEALFSLEQKLGIHSATTQPHTVFRENEAALLKEGLSYIAHSNNR
ncbi:hypothetical protein HYT55_05525 [Candidatus Woesearchaeota archaeon]|nr:hypothetical protein [Candidatus Woesearchaeota archaeon]